MTLFVLFAITVVTAYISARIAARRGRSTKAWIWLAALLGPIALLTVALLPARSRELG